MPLGPEGPGKARGNDDPGARRPASGPWSTVPRVQETGGRSCGRAFGREGGPMHRPRAILLSLSLALAACGGDAEPVASPSPRATAEASGFPVTVEAANGAVTIEE